MHIRYRLLVTPLVSATLAAAGPPLDEADVRLPYAEFRKLLDAAAPQSVREPLPPALLGLRLRLGLADEGPVLDATFRTTRFNDEASALPLIGGSFALESQSPEDAGIVMRDGMLCHLADQPGSTTLRLRLLPTSADGRISVVLPPSPSIVLEADELGPDRAIAITTDGREEIVTSGRTRALAPTAGTIELRILSANETRRALLPPEPSSWRWQHQALVAPTEGELHYHVVARAAAADGSGMSATLRLPQEARGIEVRGEDLASHRIRRDDGRGISLDLEWQTRDALDRDLDIRYRLPLRPLDAGWTLHAPSAGPDSTRSRFIISAAPGLVISADGLRGPLPPVGLPAAFTAAIGDAHCHEIEGGEAVEITVSKAPTVATAEGVVTEASWSLKIEPDGAMLIEGNLAISHHGPFGLVLDTPPGMRLLTCEIGGNPAAPIDLGDGRLQLFLPAQKTTSEVRCSFTGRGDPIEPVSGTLALALPMTPAFIRSLSWTIELPAGYLAETHGNLVRVGLQERDHPSLIRLRKNLCREERPEIAVFYQRGDL